ncbi:MAG TPA: hypothetical protein VI685_09315, partial [Candidatus Angelobacter sp.]
MPLELPELPDTTDAAATEQYKLKFDAFKLQVEACKLRAEEYRVRYEALRTLEWNTILQIYAGYTAISLAFNYVYVQPSARFHGSYSVALLAIIATCVFYFAGRYLSYRIQERLIRFNETQENYMHELSTALRVSPPKPGTGSLGHQYFWTYH